MSTPTDQPQPTWWIAPSDAARARWDAAVRTLPFEGDVWLMYACEQSDRGDRLLRSLYEALDDLGRHDSAAAERHRDRLLRGRMCLRGPDDEVAWSDRHCVLLDGHSGDCTVYGRRGHGRGDYMVGDDRGEGGLPGVTGDRAGEGDQPERPDRQ